MFHFCCALLCVLSSFATILMGKRADCFTLFVFLVFVIVMWLFITVGLQCVIVVFPDHTHLLFFQFTLFEIPDY